MARFLQRSDLCMRNFKKIPVILVFSAICAVMSAQNSGYDVFTPIGKYLSQGNSEALSAWFADNIDITILSRESTASRSQARQIVKAFFDNYSPRNFTISHTADQKRMKYALGVLTAGGERFTVTIFVNCKNDNYRIQQLKIQRI